MAEAKLSREEKELTEKVGKAFKSALAVSIMFIFIVVIIESSI